MDRLGVQHLVDEDVGLEVAHEQEGQSARVAAPDRSRGHGVAKVGGDDLDRAARGDVFGLGIEGEDQPGLARAHVHLHGDGGGDDALDEGNDLLGEAPQDDTRIGRRVGRGQLQERGRQRNLARAERGVEEMLLGAKVAQDRRRGDLQNLGDVGEGRRSESALGECGAGGEKDLIAGDARWPAHL